MPKRAKEQEEKLWEVELIIGARRTNESLRSDSSDSASSWFGCGWTYCVKWEGWVEPTWEPFDNVRNCQEHLRNFWEEAGEDAMVTNVPDFEVHARLEWLEERGVQSESMPSPTKKTKRSPAQSQSHDRSKTRTTRRKTSAQQSPSLKVKLRIRSPKGSSSTTQQTPTSSTSEVPATPFTTPISPPPTPTPEPEPANRPPDDLFDTSDTPQASDPFFTPTLAPDGYPLPSTVPDLYLSTWQPELGGLGIDPQDLFAEPAEDTSQSSSLLGADLDPNSADSLLNAASNNDFFNWPSP
ncbi:hypothetical protein K438DRAFT_1268474 [Mycena galopus ATCC 62051]|nr:hypothetical protein K438DRAFT_1268474 [Mycena galopus ATCC 62051]